MILSDAAVGPIARAPRFASKWAMPFCLLVLVLLPVLAPGQAPEPTEKESPASEAPVAPPAKEATGDQPPSADPGKHIPSTATAPAEPSKSDSDEATGQKKPHEKGKGYGTSTKIPRGMRVITITTDTTPTHSGMLNSGDRVDVFVSFRKETTEKGALETRLLLEAVEVFATESTTRENKVSEDGKRKASRTVSLLVTPEQVPYVKLAQAKGMISLKLNPSKTEVVNKLDESLLKELNDAVALTASGVEPQPAAPVKSSVSASPSTPAILGGNKIPGEGLPPGPEMKVQSPVVRQLADSLDFVGRFEALERVELRARASGALLKVNAAAGTLVKRGDLLFEIDSRIYVAELRKAEAEFTRLEAQLRRQLLDFDRVQKLAKANAASQEEVDRKRGDVDEAKAALEAAQPDVELARLKLEATRIMAPIDGRFRLERVGVGEVVLEDKTVLGTIESVDPAVARFMIDEKTFLNMSRPAPQRVEVLEFGLSYVVPSQKTAPIVEKLAKEGLPIRRVDGQKSPELATQFEITRYPTVILLVEGKEAERRTGILSEEEFRKLLATIPQRDASPPGSTGGRGLLESGAEVQIGLRDAEGYSIRGKLESVDTQVNPETGMVECRALVPNKDGVLLPGMFARVRMEIGSPTWRLCVPAAAIVRRELVSNHKTYVHNFVRVVNDRDLIEHRSVVLGQSLGDGFVVVASGLKEGERIAVPPEAPVTGSTY